MYLIISESSKSFAAHIEGKEWGTPILSERSYEDFSAWMKRSGHTFRLELGDAGEIYLFYSTNSSLTDSAQIELACEDSEINELIQNLGRDHGLTPLSRVS